MATTSSSSASKGTGGRGSSSSSSSSPTAASSYPVMSQCACGELRIEARVAPLRIDCHCPNCRKFHDSAFTSYVPMVNEDGSSLCYRIVRGETSQYRDVCHGLTSATEVVQGSTMARDEVSVDRIVCKKCRSKLVTTLATTKVNDDDSADNPSAPTTTTASFLNMGPLVDSRLPKPLLALDPISVGGEPIGWSLARPQSQESKSDENDDDNDVENDESLVFAVGHCACGQTRYRTLLPETELQHCYCRLCRQYSGGPFMTWYPAHCFEWIDADGQPSRTPPPLVRTTSHGQRHFCRNCHSCLTIVYDDQPDTIWPVAASLDDATSLHLYSVSHICCRYKPRWYQLPSDGLRRVQDAS